MTPEQRLTKIENLIETITELQFRHESEIGQLKDSQKKTDEQLRSLSQSLNRLSDMQEKTETRLISLIEHVDRVVGRVDELEGK